MPAFLEIGNDPVIRLWSVREVGDLRSNAYSGRLILTSGPKEWCLLGMGQDSLEVSFCLFGSFPTQWEQYSLLERFKWMWTIFRDCLSDAFFEDTPQRLPPVLMMASESICTVPLSVCRDGIPSDSLDLLFGSCEEWDDPQLYHIPDTEVVVAARFRRELSAASAVLFPNHRLIALEAVIILSFLGLPMTEVALPTHESELLIARLDHRILVVQKNKNSLQACNTFDSERPEEVLYYALLFDQGQSRVAYLAGFEQAEEELLKPGLVASFGSCISWTWIHDDSSACEREPWNLLNSGSLPALAFYFLRNPF